jgi:hypothetical protein
LPLPLARGEVARTTGLPEAAAAEWLRGETLAGRIRARYPARAQRGLEATFHDEAAVRSRGAAGDKDGGWCAFYSVADHIERGPQMMSEHYVVAAEWHAGELRAALARQFPAGGGRGLSGGEPEPHGRAARTGRKPKDFWPKVLGYAAGWLAERGEAPNRQSELEDVILERIEVLGGEAERSTVRSYAREMLAGYRAQLDDE